MISSKKITLIALIFVCAALVFVGFNMFIENSDSRLSDTVIYGTYHSIRYSEDDYYKEHSNADKITLDVTEVESNSKNVKFENGELTIYGGGYYILNGKLTGGSIIIDSKDSAPVFLILDNVEITSSDFAAIFVKNASKTVISVLPNTENHIADGSVYSEEKAEALNSGAAVYSKDELVINGGGIINIIGNFADGIKANDGLKIIGTDINVTAADDGINANDYIYAVDSNITVNSSGDGIKVENEDIEYGFFVSENSNFDIKSDGSGIKASSALYLEKGNFELSCVEDALHSNGDISITGGKYAISSKDDAIHADLELTLAPEFIDITNSYEGLEGAYITVNGGDIVIVSKDDAINAVGENKGGGFMRPTQGAEAKVSDEDIYLTVNGGHIIIKSDGDGFDSNGTAVLNGGVLEIYGPENGANGTVDVGDGGYVFLVNGGTLVAAGSSGMAEAPSELSLQNSIVFYLEDYYQSGSEISLVDPSGVAVAGGEVFKNFNWVCISAPSIAEGQNYTLLINGQSAAVVQAAGIVTVSGERRGGNKGWF